MYRLITSILASAMILVAFAASAVAVPIGYSVQSNGNDHLYEINLATGAATDLGLVNFGDAEGLAFAGSSLFAIGGTVGEFWDITTPPGSLVGATGPRSGSDAGLDYDMSTGKMFNINGGTGSDLYEINMATGAATLIGHSTAYMDSLAIDALGNAYGVDAIYQDLYSVNLLTGAATLIGGFVGSTAQYGLTFVGSTLYGLNSNGEIYTFDTGTGAASLVATVNSGGLRLSGFEGLAAKAVPEPATLALLGAGLAGLGFSRRRKGA